MKKHKIDFIEQGSIAEELEIEAGDFLVSINGEEMDDVFDYHYLINEEMLVVVVEKENGEEWELEIEKEYEEDLGIGFDNGLMDDYKSCTNQCIFCFIDQMPPGMRDTLYFKDDDSRLSFLQGNYITLTNMKEKDLERIIRYKLSPINVSIQTMNPTLRCEMLHNRFAGEALKKVDRLYEAGITMNGQIVLCKGVNDGKELEYSIEQLAKYAPVMESVSVVPAGLSKYRDGLYPLEAFTKEDAKAVLETIHKWQEKVYEQCGLHFIHASDEWYLLAEEELPTEENYDGYLQLENGVGMLTLLQDEFLEALDEAAEKKADQTITESRLTIATGLLPAQMLKELTDKFCTQFPQKEIEIVPIRNEFFGESITVSGLLTGQDIVKQLQGRKLGEKLLLPCNVLRSGEDVFLDDMTLQEMEKTLQVPIVIVKSNGQNLLEALLEEEC